jgi:hypothetical protein
MVFPPYGLDYFYIVYRQAKKKTAGFSHGLKKKRPRALPTAWIFHFSLSAQTSRQWAAPKEEPEKAKEVMNSHCLKHL